MNNFMNRLRSKRNCWVGISYLLGRWIRGLLRWRRRIIGWGRLFKVLLIRGIISKGNIRVNSNIPGLIHNINSNHNNNHHIPNITAKTAYNNQKSNTPSNNQNSAQPKMAIQNPSATWRTYRSYHKEITNLVMIRNHL